MKDQSKLFNPLPLPEDLLEAVHQEIKAATAPGSKRERRRRVTTPVRATREIKETTETRSTTKVPVTRPVRKPKLTLASVKVRLQRKLRQLNSGELQRVLRACGVGLAIATSIALLAKFTPIVLVLIGMLGLTWVMSHFQQITRRI